MVKESIDNGLTDFHITQCCVCNLGRSPLLRLIKFVSIVNVLGYAEFHMQQQAELVSFEREL